jgi:cell wall-associated NlpC family hydrolase
MRRLILLPLLCLALVPPALAANRVAKPWALSAIRFVTSQGLMGGGDETTFRPDAPLTAGTLAQLEADLTQQEPVPPAAPDATVTMAGLDAGLVQALGLDDAASELAAGARAAGLKPPVRFGTEAVARLLGLRTNHPAAQDDLELLPNDAATRAEAAYSAAQILHFAGSEGEGLAEQALGFQLPDLTPWQQKILRTAVSLIGYPYVWGGTSEGPEAPFGVQARGGFDCSGFVWRVYKLQAYPGAPQLAGVLRGRTTMAMSGEVPKAQRIAFADLQPADVLFFGAKGPLSKTAQIDHTGIYLGNGWFIHSSAYGVALAPLDGWWADAFAWGRRPLSEAKLG